MSVGFHFGLLKPTGVTGGDGVVATVVPQGIGATRSFNNTPNNTP